VFILKSDTLDVAVLDPDADQDRFGARYCTGGYIFQITDARCGPLLTGPTYPESFNWRDGQGIPDSFAQRPLCPPELVGTTALVIGIGLCDMATREVLQYCSWQVERTASAVAMKTTQQWEGFVLSLERTVSVSGRTVRSASRVHNIGARPLPILWFPHPFFPQPSGPELCRVSIPVTMPENPGYTLGSGGYIERRAWPSQDGFYQALDHAATSPVTVLQRHSALGLVAGTTSYTPSLFPIWGNQKTFSWEPFFERTLASGQEARWWIDYDF